MRNINRNELYVLPPSFDLSRLPESKEKSYYSSVMRHRFRTNGSSNVFETSNTHVTSNDFAEESGVTVDQSARPREHVITTCFMHGESKTLFSTISNTFLP